MSLEKIDLRNDIYYQRHYCSLYLKKDEEFFEFEYKKGNYVFYVNSIKRKIKKICSVDLDEDYYDLETPYGYGGIFFNTNDKDFLSEALAAYAQKCLNEAIISEFTRFHVFNETLESLKDYFDFSVYDRNVIYLDLNISREERWEGYSSKVRNILRKCEKDLTFSRTNKVDVFIDLYYQTMQKNNADKFYFFDKEYFEKLLELAGVELYEVKYNNITISSSFFLFSEYFGHYHLSASDSKYKQHNGNYYILDCIFDVAKERNKKYFILGGGRTNLLDDSLLKFKQKFSNLTKPFYICGKVFNKEIYDKYIELWESQSKQDAKFFLKYRLEIK